MIQHFCHWHSGALLVSLHPDGSLGSSRRSWPLWGRVGRSWSLLGLSWRSLGPLSATLRIMCNTPSDFCRQHSPFFKLAAISVHFSCRGCTPPAHHQTQAMLLSRRSIELGRVHKSGTYQSYLVKFSPICFRHPVQLMIILIAFQIGVYVPRSKGPVCYL